MVQMVPELSEGGGREQFAPCSNSQHSSTQVGDRLRGEIQHNGY